MKSTDIEKGKQTKHFEYYIKDDKEGNDVRPEIDPFSSAFIALLCLPVKKFQSYWDISQVEPVLSRG